MVAHFALNIELKLLNWGFFWFVFLYFFCQGNNFFRIFPSLLLFWIKSSYYLMYMIKKNKETDMTKKIMVLFVVALTLHENADYASYLLKIVKCRCKTVLQTIWTVTLYVYFCGKEEKDKWKKTEGRRIFMMFCPDFKPRTPRSSTTGPIDANLWGYVTELQCFHGYMKFYTIT